MHERELIMDCEPIIGFQNDDIVEQSVEIFEANIGELGGEAKPSDVMGSILENPPKYVYTRKKRDSTARNGGMQDTPRRDATMLNGIATEVELTHSGHKAMHLKKISMIKKRFKNLASNGRLNKVVNHNLVAMKVGLPIRVLEVIKYAIMICACVYMLWSGGGVCCCVALLAI